MTEDSYFMQVILPTIVVVLFIGLMVWFIIYQRGEGYDDGYKQGQIDAINGKIKFELKKNDNNETVYEKIDETQPQQGLQDNTNTKTSKHWT